MYYKHRMTDTRKIRITIREYRDDIRELPESDFKGDYMREEALAKLQREYGEEVDIVHIADVDTDEQYFDSF